MISYTEQSDELECQSESVDRSLEVDLEQNTYEKAMEKQRLSEEVKELQHETQSICEKFTTIIEEGFLMPFLNLFKKASISIHKEKMTF